MTGRTIATINAIPTDQKTVVVCGTFAHAETFRQQLAQLRPELAASGLVEVTVLAKTKNPSFNPNGNVVVYDEESIDAVKNAEIQARAAEAATNAEIQRKSREEYEARLAELASKE